MHWCDVEKAFGRALLLSVSKKKLALTIPTLILCGLLIVFCRAVAYESNDWIAMSFLFLPILLSSGVLFALGILLIRLHHHEAKHLSLDFKELFHSSSDILIGTSYLALFPVLAYLLLWICLGIFFLLKEIPHFGDFFSTVFAFGPFLLIFGSFMLCALNLGLLFFLTPVVALQSFQKTASLAKKVLASLMQMFNSFVVFLIALFPIIFLGGLLCLSAFLTNISFPITERSLLVALKWFFIMLPFAVILSPAVVFFFNFSAESFQLLQKGCSSKDKE